MVLIKYVAAVSRNIHMFTHYLRYANCFWSFLLTLGYVGWLWWNTNINLEDKLPYRLSVWMCANMHIEKNNKWNDILSKVEFVFRHVNTNTKMSTRNNVNLLTTFSNPYPCSHFDSNFTEICFARVYLVMGQHPCHNELSKSHEVALRLGDFPNGNKTQ